MNFNCRSLIWVLLSCFAQAQAQDLVSFTSNGKLLASDAEMRYQRVFKDVEPPEITPTDVHLYKVTYRSRAVDGRLIPLSGLVAMPRNGAPKGLVVYYHGTTADRENVPSRYTGAAKPEEADLAILAFANAGYAVAAPDYLGLGDHKGYHPYPLGEVNCWSGIDLIKPARKIFDKAKVSVGKDLFVTGYSEGGGIAMWAARKLQESKDPLYKLTRSAPLSGPYDLSGVQALAMLSRQSNSVWLGARVYFSSYTARGIQKNYPGIDLGKYFSPSFATYIPYVFGKELKDEGLIKKLVGKAFQMGAFMDLNRIMTLSFRDAVRAHDLRDPLLRKLADNDCYDWTPTIPMVLFCLEDDFLVVKENTLNAIAAMRARGVSQDVVRHYMITGRKFDHMKGILPGLMLARKFFDSGMTAVPIND